MTSIEFEKGALCIDATIIGENLGIEPALVHARMCEGKITSLCERPPDGCSSLCSEVDHKQPI
jgi:hypothetical protein